MESTSPSIAEKIEINKIKSAAQRRVAELRLEIAQSEEQICALQDKIYNLEKAVREEQQVVDNPKPAAPPPKVVPTSKAAGKRPVQSVSSAESEESNSDDSDDEVELSKSCASTSSFSSESDKKKKKRKH